MNKHNIQSFWEGRGVALASKAQVGCREASVVRCSSSRNFI